MACLGISISDKRSTNNKILRIKLIVEKLQKSLTLSKRTTWSLCDSDMMMDINTSRYGLPEDVKKGHFSVIAIDNGNAKRFVVPLCYLNKPSFLRLLEQAADEFGFEHEGALCVPCCWNELENILGRYRKE